MTTRKHEIEEGMRDDTHACPICNEREADSICDNCSKIMCVECSTTLPAGVFCPDCEANHCPDCD